MDKFKRIEKKYLISQSQYEELLSAIDSQITKDFYFKTTVHNVYFDTDNFDLISRSLNKPRYKGKIRLRSYDTPAMDSKVFFEIKFKYDDTVGKRRVNISLKDYYDYLISGKFPNCEKQIMNEIDYCIRLYQLKPKVVICYDRESYCAKDSSSFRITFDKNIRYREDDLHLENGSNGKTVLEEGMYIMELKNLDAIPLWMVNSLSRLKIYPASFSKYGKVYEKLAG